MGQSRDTHLDRVCDICGGVGFRNLIKTCSQCAIRRHPYCMRVVMRDMLEDWICEECRLKNDIESLNPGQAENVLDSSRKVRFDLGRGRQVACKRQNPGGKVKFIPTEEVIKLSSGYSKPAFPLIINSGSKPANFNPSPSKRTSMGSKNIGPGFNSINVRRNPSFLDLGSVLPKCRGVQISTSISRQHAVGTQNKTKVESAHVVPNEENVRKGKILNTILPDKELPILHSNTEDAMRSTRPSSSRQHTTIISSGQSFHDAAEPDNSDVPKTETWNRHKVSLYLPHAPSLYPTWTGGFKFLDTATPGTFYGGFLARPPCRVHRKAYEFSKKMPPVLQVNLLQQCRLRADIFQNGCLDLCDIAFYLFPADYMERSQKNYNELSELMGTEHSVMISYIDDMELLIFTSQQLHADSRDVFSNSNTDFFAGFFFHAKENRMKVHRELPSSVSFTDDGNANMDSGEAVDMDIDMIGGKMVGIPDIAVSKESSPEFNKQAAKETSDLNFTIRPISLEPKQECCNDSALPSKSTVKIKSECESPGIDISKLDSSDGASKGKDVLDEGGTTNQVKDEIGCPGIMQVALRDSRPQTVEAFEVCRPKLHESIKDDSLQGSQNQVKSIELSKDVSQIAISCSVNVKYEVQDVVNDHSVACPSLSGIQVKIEEHDEAKPDEIREKKAGSSNDLCIVKDKAIMHVTFPSKTETSLCFGVYPSTRVKLSVAGRSRGEGAASVGGLIRDESGKWIVGYHLNLGFCNSLATDLWALYKGMKFARDKGYERVRVESDSADAVESLKKAPSLLNCNRALVESCRSFINSEWDYKVYLIGREENLCSEWLATHAGGHQIGLSILNLPPLELIPFLEDDYKRIGQIS